MDNFLPLTMANRIGMPMGYGWVAKDPINLTEIISTGVEKIKQIVDEHQIDALAFTGSSGSIIALNAAISLKIPLIYIRKENEVSHGDSFECNSLSPIARYLIVDDLIDSGETVRRIADRISKQFHQMKDINYFYEENIYSPPKCAGIFLWMGECHSRCDNTYVINDQEVPVFF